MTKDLSRESIQKTARNFTTARILLTGVDLDLFSMLASEKLSAARIASRLSSNLRATTMLLDALTALGYMVKEDNLYRTEPSLSSLLSKDSPESILPGLQHAAHLWKTWSQLTDVVLKGGPARKWETDRKEYMKAFIGSMHLGSAQEAPKAIDAISPVRAKAFLDVGGASGSYVIAFLKTVPGMKATIFDLPDVVQMARERLSEEGLLDRVHLVAGDYNKADLPSGHDLALLSAIIHQNSHEQNIALYRKVFSALDPGGRIVIRDYVMEPDRTEPASGTIFAINMLVNTEEGNSYTFDEIRNGLTEAGFERVRLIQKKEMSSIVEAYKP
jgi:SAM-dependent methyltransferase